MNRGDVVLADLPYSDASGSKVRPALVVQCDVNNARLDDVILALITRNISRSGLEPTQLLIDPGTEAGKSSGLNFPSALKCSNLYTIDQQHVLATIGSLSPALMRKVDDCLKAALGLP